MIAIIASKIFINNYPASSGRYYAIEVKRGFGINDNGIMRGVSAGETHTFGGYVTAAFKCVNHNV